MNNMAKYLRPDEVAECMKVSDATYAFLWNEIVPLVEKAKEAENLPQDWDSKVYRSFEPTPDYEVLAAYWDKIPADIQEDINFALDAWDAEWAEVREQLG